MQVSEVMSRSVDLVSPNTQIKDAAVRPGSWLNTRCTACRC